LHPRLSPSLTRISSSLRKLVPQEKLKDGCCYPDLSNIREISQKIAAAVAKSGRSDRRDPDGGDHEDWLKHCREEMYEPTYPDLVTPGYYEEEDPVPTWTPAEREQIRREQEKSLAHQAQLYYLEKIIALYRFYIADSIVGNWQRFITSVKEAKSKFKDKKISVASYNSFIEECSEKIGFDIVKLMGYGNYVDPIRCFGDSLTIQEQKDFLIFMENYEFQPDLSSS
jgi:hypothetical protein